MTPLPPATDPLEQTRATTYKPTQPLSRNGPRTAAREFFVLGRLRALVHTNHPPAAYCRKLPIQSGHRAQAVVVVQRRPLGETFATVAGLKLHVQA